MKYKTLCRILIKWLSVYFFGLGGFSLGELAYRVVLMQVDRTTFSTSSTPHYLLEYYGGSIVGNFLVGLVIWSTTEAIANRIVPAAGMHCHECGYNLKGVTGTVCPECGVAFRATPEAEPHH